MKKLRNERTASLLLLALVLSWNAVRLWPDVRVSVIGFNDTVLHYPLVQGMVAEIERGGNPLDFWYADVGLGYPVVRDYHSLTHLMVALAYLALGKSVSLATVFAMARYLGMAMLPASFFGAAWLMELGPLGAGAAALLAPLISTNALYGLDDSSYLLRGWGLFPQSIAVHFLLLSMGFGYQAVRRAKRVVLAGALLGLTAACHLIYGYLGAVTVVGMALLPAEDSACRTRTVRTALAGGVAAAVSAFGWVPLWRDGSILNHSHWEPIWKWDSFGAAKVLEWLSKGEILDYGRPPVLTLLALAGAVVAGAGWWRSRRASSPEILVLAGSVFWIMLFFGRPTWGRWLLLAGVPANLPLHRVIGAVHIFLVLAGAIALAALWRLAAGRNKLATAAIALASVVLLYPAVTDRMAYMRGDVAIGLENRAALENHRHEIDLALDSAAAAGGRTFAGLHSTWGRQFVVGFTCMNHLLNRFHVPAVSFQFHAMSLPSDIMVRFDETRPAEYRLFNIRSVIAPSHRTNQPGFLKLRGDLGSMRVWDAPGTGYFDVVDVAAAVPTNRDSFFAINDRWLHSRWLESNRYLWLDFSGDAPAGLPRITAGEPLPDPSESGDPRTAVAGAVENEFQQGQFYRTLATLTRPAYVLFRMTWHPDWKAYVDGKPRQTAMLSPGFTGIPLEAGRHQVEMRYQPGPWKMELAAAGWCLALLLWLLESQGRFGFLRVHEHLELDLALRAKKDVKGVGQTIVFCLLSGCGGLTRARQATKNDGLSGLSHL